MKKTVGILFAAAIATAALAIPTIGAGAPQTVRVSEVDGRISLAAKPRAGLVKFVVRMARLVTPVMEAQGGGSIVNVTTYATFEPSLWFPASCVYRAGVSSFTKLYADRYGLDVVCLRIGSAFPEPTTTRPPPLPDCSTDPRLCPPVPVPSIGGPER